MSATFDYCGVELNAAILGEIDGYSSAKRAHARDGAVWSPAQRDALSSPAGWQKTAGERYYEFLEKYKISHKNELKTAYVANFAATAATVVRLEIACENIR